MAAIDDRCFVDKHVSRFVGSFRGLLLPSLARRQSLGTVRRADSLRDTASHK